MIGATIYNIIAILVMAGLSVFFHQWWIVLFSLLIVWLPDISYVQQEDDDGQE